MDWFQGDIALQLRASGRGDIIIKEDSVLRSIASRPISFLKCADYIAS